MKSIRKLTLAALFLALGLTLPFLTGQIREIGNKLLPMHIPILLCGLICGWKYGFVVGLITPLLRFVLFSMPMMPNALTMAFELATYGAVTGILYQVLPPRKWRSCVCLVIAMIVGRIIWGITSIIILNLGGSSFTWQTFIGGALLNAIPGIVIQIILIPSIMFALEKTGSINHD